MAQRQPLLKLSSVDPEEQQQGTGQQQHHQHQLARRPTGGSGTVFLAEIQELSRESLAVVYTLQLPIDSEPGSIQHSSSEASLESKHPDRVLCTLCGVG